MVVSAYDDPVSREGEGKAGGRLAVRRVEVHVRGGGDAGRRGAASVFARVNIT